MIRSTLRKLGKLFGRPLVEAGVEFGMDLTPPPPSTVYVIINRACNLRCKMCDVGQQARDLHTFFQVERQHPYLDTGGCLTCRFVFGF